MLCVEYNLFMGTYNINEGRFYNVKKQYKKIYWYFKQWRVF